MRSYNRCCSSGERYDTCASTSGYPLDGARRRCVDSLAPGSAVAARRCAAVGDDWAREDCAAARVTLSRLRAAPRRTVATQASATVATGADSTEAVVASLLEVWAWLESARPGAGPGGLSADEHRSGTLGGGIRCGDHVSRSRSLVGGAGWGRGGQRDEQSRIRRIIPCGSSQPAPAPDDFRDYWQPRAIVRQIQTPRTSRSARSCERSV